MTLLVNLFIHIICHCASYTLLSVTQQCLESGNVCRSTASPLCALLKDHQHEPNLSGFSVRLKYCLVFRTAPEVSEVAHPTTGSPVRVPPRQIPIHHRKEVEKQTVLATARNH